MEAKRRCPSDDMLSAVIHAELPDTEPPRLSDDELYAFFSLLFSAGAETTRNAIAGAMLAFVDWPDQLGQLRAGLIGSAAVEEILRWSTPSPSKRRTATSGELGGRRIVPGQKVVVWEGSANRDAGLRRPDRFDLARDPNPHLSFGHGVHFCLGRTWPAWRSGSRSKRCCLRRLVRTGRPTGVDAEQPPHRHPPPAAAAGASAGSPPKVDLLRYTARAGGRVRARPAPDWGPAPSAFAAPKIIVERPAGSHCRHWPMPSCEGSP